MMATRRAVIPVTELKTLSIECSHCGTRMVLDVERMVDVDHCNGSAPMACPCCKAVFPELAAAVRRYLQFFIDAKRLQHKLSFEIEEKP